jgi:hypothetical protein
MSWRERGTLGEEFVGAVYDLLKVDERYLVDGTAGFTYWAGDFATRVHTDIGVFRGSTSVYRVTAETDFLRGRGHLAELAVALEQEMDACSFSGPVYDPQTDVFRLFTGVYASNDQATWLKKTFAAAVTLQMVEAQEMSSRLGALFHATPASSSHPTAGFREHHDPVLDQAYASFHPSGDQPSKWEGIPSWQQAGWIMEREARHHDTDRQTYVQATFDWMCGGEDGIDVRICTDDPHPKLGNGLHSTLTVPLKLSAAAIGHLVLDLNTYEKNDYKRCHTLGSWCAHNGMLAFREFVPNALFDEDCLEEVSVNMCTRAIWANEWFCAMKESAEKSRVQGPA